VDSYKRGACGNETQVRREFIDPLFEALGWDVTREVWALQRKHQ
jgi:predicted type IV restriction endonuclease